MVSQGSLAIIEETELTSSEMANSVTSISHEVAVSAVVAEPEELALTTVSSSEVIDDSRDWIVDSGHMTGDKAKFLSMTDYNGQPKK